MIPEAGIWPDWVVELEPVGTDDARIVWEWRTWDHLVQNADESQANYGDPAANPQLIDLNGIGEAIEISDEELAQLQALGYVPEDADAEDLSSDIFHTNAIHYNAGLDQIVLSVPEYNEIWIIDHSTTTEEAAGSTGGRWGRGGDLLYRWGNPQNYHMGGPEDRRLFGQHNVHWIEPGCYGEGNLMAFNNGSGRPDSVQPRPGGFSSVDEWIPPLNAGGTYDREPGQPFGPEELEWTYDQRHPEEDDFFFSSFISGASRLPNDNTFIASGTQGRLFEVTPEGDVVWSFSNGLGVEERGQGGGRPGGRRRRGGFLAGGGPGGGGINNGPGLFRATRIALDHPAIADKNLKPLDPQPR